MGVLSDSDDFVNVPTFHIVTPDGNCHRVLEYFVIEAFDLES